MSKLTDLRSPDLRPAHALLTPTWLGALALLIANDHWLKGAGLIPEVLTGKLSDFAGMLVAPVLLAALLGVRTRRALLACHLATAAVFTGIQLSPAFAGVWSAFMGVFGHPWVITCDPTDLIALPMLALSWHLLVPAMDGQPLAVGLRRSAAATLSVVGLWATVATSYDGDWDDTSGWGETEGDWGETEGEGGWQDVQGSIYIHNPNEFALALHIRELKIEVDLDCEAVMEDPGRLLPEQAFGAAQHWSLPPTTNVGVELDRCSAVWVGGEGIEDQIIFLGPDADSTYRNFPGSHDTTAEVGSAGAVIYMDAEGSRWAGLSAHRFSPRTDSLPQPEGCEASDAERRLAWSPLPASKYEILALESGADGCHEIELIDLADIANETGESRSWYLCVPAEALPFEVGREYAIYSYGDDRWGTVDVTLLDPVSFEAVVDESGRPLLAARFGRGVSELGTLPLALTLSAAKPAAGSCPWIVERDECALVDRLATVRTADDQILEPGVHALVEEIGRRHQVLLTRARVLALADASCTSGSSWVPNDLDIAVLTRSTL